MSIWNQSHAGVYTRVAESLTVKDIYIAFAGLASSTDTHGSIRQRLQASESGSLGQPFLVGGSDGKSSVYWPLGIDEDDLEWTDPIDECLNDFYDDEFVTANTTMLDAIGLFREKVRNIVVVDGTQYVGVLRYEDLTRLPASLSLLALTLHLEEAALALCQHFPESFDSLSEMRRASAKDQFTAKFNVPPSEWKAKPSPEQIKRIDSGIKRDADRLAASTDPQERQLIELVIKLKEQSKLGGIFGIVEERGLPLAEVRKHISMGHVQQLLIECTNFCDKGEMIRGAGLLIGLSKSKIKSVFFAAQALRNTCAHPGVLTYLAQESVRPFPGPEQLRNDIRDIREVIRAIQEVTPRIPEHVTPLRPKPKDRGQPGEGSDSGDGKPHSG